MLAQYLDLTDQYNTNETEGGNVIVFEVSNYDYCVIQSIGVAVDIKATIDGGAIEGVQDDSPTTATNFTTIGGTKLIDGVFTTTATNNSPVRLAVVGRYIKLKGSGPATKLLIMLAKIG